MSGCLKALLIGLAIAVVLGLGSCVLLVVAADEASDDLEEQDADELADVSEPTCEVDDVGFMVATMDVTNESSERSNYFIEVTFEGPDGSQLATGNAVVNALEPDQSTTTEALSATDGPDDGEFTCRVTDVERISDET